VAIVASRQNCADHSAAVRGPIIIAASGGASRAGVHASVIGKLMDGGGASAGGTRKAVFAISSVSGSSVGAVMRRGGLAASKDAATASRRNSGVYTPT